MNKQFSIRKRKKILIPVFLWVITILSGIVWEKIITYFNLDSHNPIVILFEWLSLGVINCLFFFSIIDAFKDKLGKFYIFLIWFLIAIWLGGLLYIIFILLF